MKTLVTGAAGFIGYHLSRRLCAQGDQVVGLDNLNDYYDVGLKKARLSELQSKKNFEFAFLDLVDMQGMSEIFARHRFGRVVHLAAQVGVRYSLTNPHAYVQSNMLGFLNVLEGCRHSGTGHLVFASSSSVYGANTRLPFSVHDNVDHPVSLYAASKKSNELMAHCYAHIYGIPVTGLRFFTVYGPWGRPDMAVFRFTKAILEGHPIDVYNHGNHRRDFTYIDDIVEGVVRVLDHHPVTDMAWSSEHPDPATSRAPYRIYNIGNHTSIELRYLIDLLESALGRKAIRNFLPLQPGDVPETCADVKELFLEVGFEPSTPIEAGIRSFVDWYRSFYHC